jgi:hypothetical protein
MLSVPVQAQNNIRSATFVNIKPDRAGDFQAAVKEGLALLKKGGSERYSYIWQSTAVAGQYVVVQYYAKWADLDAGPEAKMKDQAAQLAAIGARIVGCIESQHRVIDELMPELSLPPAAEIPKMVRVLQTRVRPEKINDYTALVKSDLLPAAKKAGMTTFVMGQTRYGAPTSMFVTATGLSKWGDLDGGAPIQKAMGEEGYQRFLAKLRPLTIESEATIYRYMADLSHPAPAR